MKKYLAFFFFFFTLGLLPIIAQEQVYIQGYLKSAETNEPITTGIISLIEERDGTSKILSFTSSSIKTGEFKIAYPTRDVKTLKLSIQAIGFERKTVLLDTLLFFKGIELYLSSKSFTLKYASIQPHLLS